MQAPDVDHMYLFGEVAQHLGFLDQGRIQQALLQQQAMRQAGHPIHKSRLGQACASLNLLSTDQVKEVLREQRRLRQLEAERRLLGDRLGEFALLDRLGEGGMGTVYKARTPQGQIIALKILRKNLTQDQDFVNRFNREMLAATKLRHPNIVQTHQVGVDAEKGIPYIAMDFVDGENLLDRLTRDKLIPERDALTIAGYVATALVAAHEIGWVHRDVKPENVFLDRNGQVKLGDLGTAKSTRGDTDLTAEGQIVGTPYYLSPEQAQGDRADSRADLYSLGAMLYHMLTGQVPFEGATPFEIVMAHINHEPREPREINPGLSVEACAITMTLMAKDPADRYQTARELAEDIGRVLHGQPLQKVDLVGAGATPPIGSSGALQTKPGEPAATKKGCFGMVLVGVLGLGLFALEWLAR
jgi:serine/threonine protein kinase